MYDEWLLTACPCATLQYISAPIYTLKMEDLAKFYEARKARDICGIDGYTQYMAGQPTNVVLTSQNKCKASITRAAGVEYVVSVIFWLLHVCGGWAQVIVLAWGG